MSGEGRIGAKSWMSAKPKLFWLYDSEISEPQFPHLHMKALTMPPS